MFMVLLEQSSEYRAFRQYHKKEGDANAAWTPKEKRRNRSSSVRISWGRVGAEVDLEKEEMKC